jgi:O-antigen/teichoic acid export membrane protein
VAFSLYSAAVRFYTDYKDNPNKLKRFYGTIVSFIIISGIAFFILGLVFRNVIVNIFFQGIDFFPIVFIAFLSLIFFSLLAIHQSILEGMQQGKKLTKLNLIVFLATTSLKIVLIGVCNLKALGFLLAQLIVYIVYFVFMIIDLKKNDFVDWTIDFPLLKETLKYSIPLMPHNLSTHIAYFASRVFINVNVALANVGLYSIAMEFGNLIDLVQVAVNKAVKDPLEGWTDCIKM